MASPDHVSYSALVTFVDRVGGTGGTVYQASNVNALQNAPATLIDQHIDGKHQDGTVGNRHGTMDIVDYNSANTGTEYKLSETTTYANAATNLAGASTQWARNDMFATLFKAILGGAGTTLTARNTAWTALSGGADLTTLYNLLHGGSPTLGSVLAVSPSSGVTAGVFRGASGDPNAQNVLDVTNNAGSTHYFVVTAADAATPVPAVIQARGTTVVVATRTDFSAFQARSSDTTAGRKVISAQTSAGVEGLYITNDGTIVMTGSATPALSATGQSKQYTTTAGVVMVSQNGGAYVPLVGAAAASGVAGAVQFAAAGNTFSSDASNFFYDNTNDFLGLGTNAPTSQIDQTGAHTMRGMVAPAVSSAGQARIYAGTDGILRASQNGSVYSPLIVGNSGVNQTITAPTFAVTGAFTVSGPIAQGNAGTAAGFISSFGQAAGFAAYDRGGTANAVIAYLNGTTFAFNYSVDSLDKFQMNASTGALTTKSIAATTPAVGTIAGLFSNIAGQTADTFRIDGSAVTNGVVSHFDSAGHYYSTQAAVPTATAGTSAGTGPTITLQAGSTDRKGVIQVTAGTTPAASNIIVTVNFRNAYAAAPWVTVVPANVGAAALTAVAGGGAWADYAGMTTTGFTIRIGSTALTASGVYQWSYECS